MAMVDDGWTRLQPSEIREESRIGFALGCGVTVAAFVVAGMLSILLRWDSGAGLTLGMVAAFAAVLAGPAVVERVWAPVAVVAVSRPQVGVRESVRVRWEISRLERATSITVRWLGRETAIRYAYDNEYFITHFVDQALSLSSAGAGSATVEVPADVMPSFRSKSAEIVWSIRVDVATELGTFRKDFPVRVVPAAR